MSLPARRRWDIVSLGEALVEFNSVPEESGYATGYGGDTSNCLVAAARLGARCAYITQVGDDDAGAQLLAMWRREGVSCEGIRTLPGAPTGAYFVHHDGQGHTFTYRRDGSAASRIVASGLPLDLVRDSAWLHLSGISMALGASARDSTLAALSAALEAGTALSFDLNHRPALGSSTSCLANAHRVLEAGPLFFISLDEARSLLGLDRPGDVERWALDHGACAVVVKLGSNGCLVSDRGRLEYCAGWPVRALDATGAGDCFAGACLSRLVAGDSLFEAARFANVAAALSTRGYGAVHPLPRMADVMAALHEGPATGVVA